MRFTDSVENRRCRSMCISPISQLLDVNKIEWKYYFTINTIVSLIFLPTSYNYDADENRSEYLFIEILL
jgi:hypothetical protein